MSFLICKGLLCFLSLLSPLILCSHQKVHQCFSWSKKHCCAFYGKEEITLFVILCKLLQCLNFCYSLSEVQIIHENRLWYWHQTWSPWQEMLLHHNWTQLASPLWKDQLCTIIPSSLHPPSSHLHSNHCLQRLSITALNRWKSESIRSYWLAQSLDCLIWCQKCI